MESCSSLSSSLSLKHSSLTTLITPINNNWRSRKIKSRVLQVSAFSYQKFIHFALNETKRQTVLVPSPLQVLDFAVFARPEFDVPIFCANFFTTASMNIIVLDYKEKYYKSLLPLGLKYAELFPWGGKLTSESLQFFSPIVIWTKFTSTQYRHDTLYSAFVDYYKAWLKLIEHAPEDKDASQIICNQEAQHKYLTWRAEKDPGHGILKRLIGESLAKDVVRNFLFNGINELGSKGFLDYFPEYCCEDGNINKKRSIIGKSFENRPWDAKGEFLGNNIKIY
ncbi:phytochromobilin:ferredoxin oxidoreductase, chloroplastic isoform X4 [Jatropha curcas]|uniref:phytochromobilin:ferredoxin oxidoreductase, chloroplastic isoform X4 n=1 Tax=Jatropha curcas TaxID=180498 RepID=UPI0005FBEA02|nr:phytochromobilin:ferredoxin oxidoreductase, chloroplastic isoform X4 [Jatropha curcas]